MTLQPSAALALTAALVAAGCLAPLLGSVGSEEDEIREYLYGTVQAVERDGESLNVTLEAGIVDCAQVDLVVHRNLTAPQGGVPPSSDGSGWEDLREGLERYGYRYLDEVHWQRNVTTLANVTEGRIFAVFVVNSPEAPGTWLLGRAVEVDPGNGTLTLEDPGPGHERSIVHARGSNATPTFREARRGFGPRDLVPGRSLALKVQPDEAGNPSLARISPDRSLVVTACSYRRKYDLRMLPTVAPRTLPANTTVEVRPAIENQRGRVLSATFGNATVVDEHVLIPGKDACRDPGRPHSTGGQRSSASSSEDWRDSCDVKDIRTRLEEARVSACTVDVPEVVEVPPHGKAPAPFQVTCNRTVPRQEVSRLEVWAPGSFAGELGGRHPIPPTQPRAVAVEFDAPG